MRFRKTGSEEPRIGGGGGKTWRESSPESEMRCRRLRRRRRRRRKRSPSPINENRSNGEREKDARVGYELAEEAVVGRKGRAKSKCGIYRLLPVLPNSAFPNKF